MQFVSRSWVKCEGKHDKVDDESKTLADTVVEGDPNYSSLKAEMHFTSAATKKTEATWTAKYEPVGEAGPPEHIKEISVHIFKTFERAAKEKRTVRHTRTIDAPPDTIWNICKNEITIVPKALPHLVDSIDFLEGYGEVGSIRIIRMGPAVPNGMNVIERIDINDDATPRFGYTVLQGDPKYKHLTAVMQFTDGPEEGTTTATWVGTYVPQESRHSSSGTCDAHLESL